MNAKTMLNTLLICAVTCLPAGAPATSFAQEVDDCIACHKDTTLTKANADGSTSSLYVDKDAFLKSIHGEAGYTCVDCHEDADPKAHPKGGMAEVKCQGCHEEVAATHSKSFHGKLKREGNEDAPECYDCHTTHAVMYADNPASSVHPDNLPKTCGACHKNEAAPVICEAVLDFAKGDPDVLQRVSIASALSIVTARLKGHGKVNFGRTYSTKRCSDCHFDAVSHGDEQKQPEICADCHDMQRSALLFGKIHKADLFSGPTIFLLLIMYAVCIGGLVLFFRKTCCCGKKAKQAE